VCDPDSTTEDTLVLGLVGDSPGVIKERKEESNSSNNTELVQWAFGIGNEGIFVKPTSASGNVVIVGRRFPWWGIVVAWLDLKIQTILLYDLDLASLAATYFGSQIPIRQMSNNSSLNDAATKEALKIVPL
jgi:hypothetical protein